MTTTKTHTVPECRGDDSLDNNKEGPSPSLPKRDASQRSVPHHAGGEEKEQAPHPRRMMCSKPSRAHTEDLHASQLSLDCPGFPKNGYKQGGGAAAANGHADELSISITSLSPVGLGSNAAEKMKIIKGTKRSSSFRSAMKTINNAEATPWSNASDNILRRLQESASATEDKSNLGSPLKKQQRKLSGKTPDRHNNNNTSTRNPDDPAAPQSTSQPKHRRTRRRNSTNADTAGRSRTQSPRRRGMHKCASESQKAQAKSSLFVSNTTSATDCEVDDDDDDFPISITAKKPSRSGGSGAIRSSSLRHLNGSAAAAAATALNTSRSHQKGRGRAHLQSEQPTTRRSLSLQPKRYRNPSLLRTNLGSFDDSLVRTAGQTEKAPINPNKAALHLLGRKLKKQKDNDASMPSRRKASSTRTTRSTRSNSFNGSSSDKNSHAPRHHRRTQKKNLTPESPGDGSNTEPSGSADGVKEKITPTPRDKRKNVKIRRQPSRRASLKSVTPITTDAGTSESVEALKKITSRGSASNAATCSSEAKCVASSISRIQRSSSIGEGHSNPKMIQVQTLQW